MDKVLARERVTLEGAVQLWRVRPQQARFWSGRKRTRNTHTFTERKARQHVFPVLHRIAHALASTGGMRAWLADARREGPRQCQILVCWSHDTHRKGGGEVTLTGIHAAGRGVGSRGGAQVTAVPMRAGLRPDSRQPSGGVRDLRLDSRQGSSASIIPLRPDSRCPILLETLPAANLHIISGLIACPVMCNEILLH